MQPFSPHRFTQFCGRQKSAGHSMDDFPVHDQGQLTQESGSWWNLYKSPDEGKYQDFCRSVAAYKRVDDQLYDLPSLKGVKREGEGVDFAKKLSDRKIEVLNEGSYRTLRDWSNSMEQLTSPVAPIHEALVDLVEVCLPERLGNDELRDLALGSVPDLNRQQALLLGKDIFEENRSEKIRNAVTNFAAVVAQSTCKRDPAWRENLLITLQGVEAIVIEQVNEHSAVGKLDRGEQNLISEAIGNVCISLMDDSHPVIKEAEEIRDRHLQQTSAAAKPARKITWRSIVAAIKEFITHAFNKQRWQMEHIQDAFERGLISDQTKDQLASDNKTTRSMGFLGLQTDMERYKPQAAQPLVAEEPVTPGKLHEIQRQTLKTAMALLPGSFTAATEDDWLQLALDHNLITPEVSKYFDTQKPNAQDPLVLTFIEELVHLRSHPGARAQFKSGLPALLEVLQPAAKPQPGSPVAGQPVAGNFGRSDSDPNLSPNARQLNVQTTATTNQRGVTATAAATTTATAKPTTNASRMLACMNQHRAGHNFSEADLPYIEQCIKNRSTQAERILGGRENPLMQDTLVGIFITNVNNLKDSHSASAGRPAAAPITQQQPVAQLPAKESPLTKLTPHQRAAFEAAKKKSKGEITENDLPLIMQVGLLRGYFVDTLINDINSVYANFRNAVRDAKAKNATQPPKAVNSQKTSKTPPETRYSAASHVRRNSGSNDSLKVENVNVEDSLQVHRRMAGQTLTPAKKQEIRRSLGDENIKSTADFEAMMAEIHPEKIISDAHPTLAEQLVAFRKMQEVLKEVDPYAIFGGKAKFERDYPKEEVENYKADLDADAEPRELTIRDFITMVNNRLISSTFITSLNDPVVRGAQATGQIKLIDQQVPPSVGVGLTTWGGTCWMNAGTQTMIRFVPEETLSRLETTPFRDPSVDRLRKSFCQLMRKGQAVLASGRGEMLTGLQIRFLESCQICAKEGKLGHLNDILSIDDFSKIPQRYGSDFIDTIFSTLGVENGPEITVVPVHQMYADYSVRGTGNKGRIRHYEDNPEARASTINLGKPAHNDLQRVSMEEFFEAGSGAVVPWSKPWQSSTLPPELRSGDGKPVNFITAEKCLYKVDSRYFKRVRMTPGRFGDMGKALSQRALINSGLKLTVPVLNERNQPVNMDMKLTALGLHRGNEGYGHYLQLSFDDDGNCTVQDDNRSMTFREYCQLQNVQWASWQDMLTEGDYGPNWCVYDRVNMTPGTRQDVVDPLPPTEARDIDGVTDVRHIVDKETISTGQQALVCISLEDVLIAEDIGQSGIPGLFRVGEGCADKLAAIVGDIKDAKIAIVTRDDVATARQKLQWLGIAEDNPIMTNIIQVGTQQLPTDAHAVWEGLRKIQPSSQHICFLSADPQARQSVRAYCDQEQLPCSTVEFTGSREMKARVAEWKRRNPQGRSQLQQ